MRRKRSEDKSFGLVTLRWFKECKRSCQPSHGKPASGAQASAFTQVIAVVSSFSASSIYLSRICYRVFSSDPFSHSSRAHVPRGRARARARAFPGLLVQCSVSVAPGSA